MARYPSAYLVVLGVLVGQSIRGCAGLPAQAIPTAVSAPIASSTQPSIPTTYTAMPPVPFREDLSCWPVLPLKQGGDIRGSLLIGSSKPPHVFAWDVSSFGVKTPDKSEQADWMLSRPIVSPDGKVAAAIAYNEDELVLFSSNESKVFTLPRGDYRGVLKFAADGSVVILGYRPDFWPGNYVNGSGLTIPYYIFDPAADHLTAYSVFLPGFTLGSQGTYPFAFSPDMHYIVYKNTLRDDGSDRYTLLDLKTDKIVWVEPSTPPGLYAADSFPAWKPSADILTYVLWSDWHNGDGNYYSVSLDGAVTQLTQFNQATPRNLDRGGLPRPSWSPNGRYMAFRLVQSGRSALYIWDDQEKVAYKPCLPDENEASDDYSVSWSFDSNHLLLRLAYGNPISTGTPTDALLIVRSTDVILGMSTKTILELPDENKRGEYSSYDGTKQPLGWVNWEIP